MFDLTGWHMVSIGVLGQVPERFLNRHPNGQLVDPYGFTSIDELREGAEEPRLEILGPAAVTDLECDDTMAGVMTAIAHFEHQPFPGLRSRALLWARQGSLRPWLP
jgi:hypothetical protein